MRGLAVGPESLVDILLAKRFAERSIGRIDTALPAGLDFRLPGELLLHLEIGVDERLREPGSGGVEQVPAHVGLQRVQRLGVDDAIDLLEEFGIGDVEFAELRRIDAGEVAVQLEVWRGGDDFIARSSCGRDSWDHGEGCGPSTPWRERSRCAGGLRGVRRFGGRPAGEGEHLGHVVDQMLAHLFMLVVVLDVVVAVGQESPPWSR